MNILIFGATGMVGQGVLRECLLDPSVDRVLAVVRHATGRTHPRLREIVLSDVTDLAAHESVLTGIDACFFCLGVSSAGMSEARYSALTYDLTLSVARRLASLDPGMTFVYVSGMGTDTSEQGRSMWARVKGRTENELLRLPFKAAYMFRPGAIIPLHGIRSRTAWVRILYAATKPAFLLARKLFPEQVVTTEQIGQAMLAVARQGYGKPHLEPRDIVRTARGEKAAAT